MGNLYSSYSKNYDELEYRDDFMFGKVMEDPILCHDVLECLLQQPVGELSDIQPQREFRYTTDGKPIRIDIYTQDDDSVYDAEMQNLNHKSIESLALPKRSRFYQSSIDIDAMNKTDSYGKLPTSYVIFICTFDPFGKGFSRYTFRNRCDEDRDIELGDASIKCFYNCSYDGNDIPDELKQLYVYVMNGQAQSNLANRIDNAVMRARQNNEWRSAYMKERALFMDLRNEGREEGREEGRTELLISQVCKKLKKGKSAINIAEELEEDKTRIQIICDVAAEFAPEYDINKIMVRLESIIPAQI